MGMKTSRLFLVCMKEPSHRLKYFAYDLFDYKISYFSLEEKKYGVRARFLNIITNGILGQMALFLRTHLVYQIIFGSCTDWFCVNLIQLELSQKREV